MKILNSYAGIGGNRKLWGGVDVTAIEFNEKIAQIYKDNFPDDEVIVTDAHEYLLKHYMEYDLIWSSVPCQSHSRVARLGVHAGTVKPVFIDMKLYQEILFLKHNSKALWVVENVIPYYQPLIPAKKIASHLFWSNFPITDIENKGRGHHSGVVNLQKRKGFDLSKYSGIDKRQVLRNCVEPEVGLHVLNCALASKKIYMENSQALLF